MISRISNLSYGFCLCIGLISIFLVANAVGEDFMPKKMGLLGYQYSPNKADPNRLNAIFRSNGPFIDGKFAYNELLESMKETAMRDAKLVLPKDNFHMVVVSLLGSDEQKLKIEREYFKKYPERGEVISFPIVGTSEDPRKFSDEEILSKAQDLSWMEDDIPLLVSKLQSLLNDFSQPKSLFIVVHCVHGQDRTGEVSGAFWIANEHKSWEQVAGTNWRTAQGHIKYDNQRALTWYCHHLQMYEEYSGLTCSHENLGPNSLAEPKLLGWDEEDGSNGLVYCLAISIPIGGVSLLVIVSVLLVLAFVYGRVLARKTYSYILLKNQPTHLDDETAHELP